MRNILLLLTAFIALLATSCSKEGSLEDPNSVLRVDSIPSQPSSPLLRRFVQVESGDSLVTTYNYDAQRRLVQMIVTRSSVVVRDYRLVRNAAGTLLQFIEKDEDLLFVGLDSLVTNFGYNASTNRYTHSSYRYTGYSGNSISDSTAIVYNPAGQVQSLITYEDEANRGFSPIYKTDFTYQNGNLTGEKNFDYDVASASFIQNGNGAYTFNTTPNASTIGIEALFIRYYWLYNTNAISTVDYTDIGNNGNSYQLSFSHTYNSLGKPQNSDVVSMPSNNRSSWRYYYQ